MALPFSAPPFSAAVLVLPFCYSYLRDDILSSQDEGIEQVVPTVTSQFRQGDLGMHEWTVGIHTK